MLIYSRGNWWRLGASGIGIGMFVANERGPFDLGELLLFSYYCLSIIIEIEVNRICSCSSVLDWRRRHGTKT